MNIPNYKNVFICATEQSGDNIGSCIINELLIKNKNIKFDGVGGSKISPFLNNQYFSLNDFKSIGIFEILPGDYYGTGVIEENKASFYCISEWKN